MEDHIPTSESTPLETPVTQPAETGEGQNRSKMWAIILGVVVLVALMVTGLVLLIRGGPEVSGLWRDIFIIIMALESIVIGAALVILIIQVATLINLVQNEIKPILNSTNETVSTLRGTAAFLSDNLAGPVIEMNAQLAGVRKFFELIRFGKNRR